MKIKAKAKCQVCGANVTMGNRNCDAHKYVRKRFVVLVQELIFFRDRGWIDSFTLTTLAKAHKCSVTTVRNNLKREGYTFKKGWEFNL